MSNISGWMTPSGKFVTCNFYMHLKMIASTPELRRYVPDIDFILITLESIDKDCCDLIDEGEHPGWHNYEIPERDYTLYAINALRKAGCLRIGTMGTELFFDGTVTAITYQAAKDLAASHNMTPVFE